MTRPERAALHHQIPLLLSLASLLVAAVVAVVALVPTAPPVTVPAEGFSAARAFEHILAIAQEPRPIGGPGNRRARANIVEQLHLLGLEAELQTARARDYYGSSGGSVEVVNVVTRIPGTASTGAVALMGHYDSFPGAPGANDDASAVAIMLETARALLAVPRLRNDVILLFTDGEEPAPRFDSSAFVAGHPWAADIGFLINLEALGAGGPSLLAGVGSAQAWTVRQYAAAVPYPAAFSFVTATAELIGGSSSDFSTFRSLGTPGVEFAYLHGSPIYHTSADAPERVSLRSLYQHGANTLALARHVGNLDLGVPHDDAGCIFFTVGRLYTVRYPEAWTLPIALAAGAVLAVVGCRQRAWLRVLQSSGATVVSVVVAAVAAGGIWLGLAGWRSAMGLVESYTYLAGLILLDLGVVAAVARLARRQIPAEPDALGVLLVWWLLGVLLAVWAPGMSYLFAWPALAGGLVLVCRSLFGSRRWSQLASLMLVAGTTLVLLVPAMDIFYQLAQPRPGNPDSQALPLVAVPVLLLALVGELLRTFWVPASGRMIPQQ